MKLILLLAMLVALTGCGYSRVYFNTMQEATNAFGDLSTVKCRQITDPHHKYVGKFEVRYKPF